MRASRSIDSLGLLDLPPLGDNKHMKTRILFVCMGNICRSPAAEGVFLDRIKRAGIANQFVVDSAGTGGWHSGNPADSRSIDEGQVRGYHLPSRARQVVTSDWTDFDVIVCMDLENHANLIDMGAPEEKVRLLLEWHPTKKGEDVPDPYYGGDDGFVHMYDLIDSAIDGLVAEYNSDIDDSK